MKALSIKIEGLDAPFYLYYVWDKSYLLRENDMTRYELLQSLERLYPSRKDWFIADEDGGIVKVCFNVDPDEDEESDDE